MTKKGAVMVAIVALLLLIPAVSMQFSDEVQWSIFDFVVVGALLVLSGSAIVLVTEKIRTLQNRFIFITAIVLAFLLVWVELAVGVFGTVFAGN